MLLGLYAIGLAYFITGDSVAAREPKRFWWALALWFVFAPINLANFVLNRMWP